MSNVLAGKRALVVGVANDHSIAWGVAAAMHAAGAELALTYLNAKAEPHVRPLAERLGATLFEPLDVAHEAAEEALFKRIAQAWGGLDILVHSIAFAPGADLHGRGCARPRASRCHGHRCIPSSACAGGPRPLMKNGGSCQTLSFYGAEKVISTYNMMGPVKAALEAVTRELARARRQGHHCQCSLLARWRRGPPAASPPSTN